MTDEELTVASQLYAFVGNSLLVPMSRTEQVGLDPVFWREAGGLLGGALAQPAEELAVWAERVASGVKRSELVQRVSVEFTKLFVGPPKPAAAPWESANGVVESHVGFGEATFAMRKRLRDLGLAVRNENNQYEDHLGIELLYLSELCRRAVEAADGDSAMGGVGEARATEAADTAATSTEGGTARAPQVDAAFAKAFVHEHPLAWIGRFREKVDAAEPDGYFVRLLAFAQALLEWQVA